MVKGRNVPKQAIDPHFCNVFCQPKGNLYFETKMWKSRNIVNLEFSQMLQRKPL